MKVSLADLHAQYLAIKPEVDAAIHQVIESSQFILGKAVSDFEQAFAKAHQTKHCIAAGSGTDALHAALWALGVGKGDAVITTPFTFIATVEAISLTGATPVFVDIDPETYTIDPEKLEECLRSKRGNAKAIIPIHLYGQPAAMDSICEIAKKYKLSVIEDACQSHLAQYDGIFVGNFGVAGCFSFYPSKNLGAYGEGGAVTTNDDALAKRIRLLRDHGQVEKYKHEFEGHNYRMDNIQGAVLGVKLKYLHKWTERRRQIAAEYKKHLAGIGNLVMPYELSEARHVFHLFVVRTKSRNALQKFLTENGIATTIAYPIPLHLQKAYRHLGYSKGDFPESETAAQECLALPIYAEMTDEQVEYVIEKVKVFFRD
ncbi:MAG: DegT/DnrJ/EryC1/StrS family aminotransferase [Ignavibacteriae bacterium]|nr:DegT/DnrJ/EryC1/StrS family aminotransferase [Ignavibacteriota bacterium]